MCIAMSGYWAKARADDREPDDDDGGAPARFELSVGAQAFRDAWALYSGVTAAPFGGLDRDGVRVRAVGGYGAYAYSGRRAAGTGSRIVEFDGQATFADLLAGYQKQLGALTVKGFVGLAAAGTRISPDDPETAIRGGLGAKLVLETWWTISEQAWGSLDVSWSTLHDSYAGRGRLGWRIAPAVSIGVEAGAAGNTEGDIARAGGFLRYEWAAGEASVSAGWSNDKLLDGTAGTGLAAASTPYATLSWLTKF